MKLNKYHKLFLLAVVILIFMIPSGYAIDNQTDDLQEIEEVQTISAIDEDNLKASNDYFFDSSVENDTGDGTKNNPYKYLTSDRIRGNCNIYLSDGEYELDNSKTIERVNFIGSNPLKTIIKYDGVGFSVNSLLALRNVTLMDMSITNRGNLDATNVVFNFGYGS